MQPLLVSSTTRLCNVRNHTKGRRLSTPPLFESNKTGVYLTNAGFFESNFQPGIKYCMLIASLRSQYDSFR